MPVGVQSQGASDAASEAGQVSPKRTDSLDMPNGGGAKSLSTAPPEPLRDVSEFPKDVAAGNGSLFEADLLAEMTPEEMAFMRSLGWEETVEEEGTQYFNFREKNYAMTDICHRKIGK